jgi:hypothetical protein
MAYINKKLRLPEEAAAEDLKNMDTSELALFIQEHFGVYMYTAVKKILADRSLSKHIDDCYRFVVARISMNYFAEIRTFHDEAPFKIYLSVITVSKIQEYLVNTLKLPPDAGTGDYNKNMIHEYNRSAAKGVNPELEYLAFERKDLLNHGIEVVGGSFSKLTDYEKLIVVSRIKRKRSFKEINTFFKITNSIYEFNRIIKKIKTDTYHKLNNAICDYYGS